MSTRYLFVYGTLRRGAAGEPALRLASEARHLGLAEIPGELLLVDRYPGLVDGAGLVVGDLFELANPRKSLPWLDEYEGPEFEREVRPVTSPDGREIRAWVYRYLGEVGGLSRIPGGDFLRGG